MSKLESGYDEGARWLLSDSQILGRITKESHAQGILLTLAMPYGEDFQAVVAKMNADSMTQYCELARGEYNAWKGEQVAKAERTSRESERSRSNPQEVQAPAKESVAVNPLDFASVSTRIADIHDRLFELMGEVCDLQREQEILEKIQEVLNASKDVSETVQSVQGTEVTESRKGDPMDHPSCEEQLQSARSNCSESIDTELAAPALDVVVDTSGASES